MLHSKHISSMKLPIRVILVLSLLFSYAISENCPRAKVEKEACDKGQRLEHTTYYAQNVQGQCVQKTQSLYKPCSLLPGKHFCQCSVVGDPHYRTFNGKMIHYFGNCTYSLAETLDSVQGNCAFKIRGKNERRHNNPRVSYLRYITVEMAGKKIQLHQYGRVFVDGEIASLPIEVNKDVQVFHSGTLVQLVSKACGVEVSFDGDANGYIMVSKDYAGKMSGICGSCVTGHNDLMTKQGVDVSKDPNKFNLIGDSYAIESVFQGAHACQPAEALPATICTKDQETKLVKPLKQCGALLDSNGPFKDCLNKVNGKQLYESCKIDICTNANDQKALKAARCEIFKAMEESCAMNGITGLQWRAALNCPLRCGKNKVYSAKMNPCPKTCENHFFGTRKQCYDLPSQEGCQCKPGYLLDGMLCVKPSQCQCLEGCRDTAEKKDCEIWVSEGKCKKFPRLMKKVCSASCKFCKKEVEDVCVDRISTERCEQYREEGKCNKKFYKVACGLTCHPFTCPCKTPEFTTSPCDKKHMVQRVTQVLWMRKHGKCVPEISSAVQSCGKCGGKVDVKLLPCNVCHGLQRRIESWSQREGNVCLDHRQETMTTCPKCPQTKREIRSCINNNQEQLTIIYFDNESCNECKKRIKTVRNPILCKSRKLLDKCDEKTCYIRESEITHATVNCRCKRLVKQKFTKCCCSKETIVHKECKNNCNLETTIKYSFKNGKCVAKAKTKRNCPKLPEPLVILGKCDDKSRYAIDKTTLYVMNNCKIIPKETYTSRVCKCDKPYEEENCAPSTGEKILTLYTDSLIKNKDGDKQCIKMTKNIKREQVICPRDAKKIIGKCDRKTCKAEEKIITYLRDACKCIESEHIKKIDCCCKKDEPISTCIDNKMVVKTVKKKLVENQCKKDQITYEIKNIQCPAPVVTQGKCNKKSGNFLKTTVTHTIKNCECVKQTSRQINPCAEKCPLPEEEAGICDKKTCSILKKKITYNFNGEKCVKIERHFKEACCAPKVEKSRYCDKETGNNIDQKITYKLVESNGKKVLNKIVNMNIDRVNCNTPSPVEESCGKSKKNMKKVLKSVVNKDYDKCLCQKPKQIVEYKTCACPKTKPLPDKCIDDKFVEKSTAEYKLKNGECKQVVSSKRVMVSCDKPKTSLTKCKDCTYLVQRIYYEPKDCKCIKKIETIAEKKCCCKKKKVVKKCLRNKLCAKIIVIERLQNQECVKSTFSRVHEKVCKNKSEIKKGKCINCEQELITNTYVVENCKCVPKKTSVTKQRCCCPQPNRKNRCYKDKQIITDTSYDLIKGKCFPTSTTKALGPICPPESYIRGQCDWKTMTQNLRRIYYVPDKETCTCNQRETRSTIKCQCDLPMVFKDENNSPPGKINVVLRVYSPGGPNEPGVPNALQLGFNGKNQPSSTTGQPIDALSTLPMNIPTIAKEFRREEYFALTKKQQKLLSLKPNEKVPIKLSPEDRAQLNIPMNEPIYELKPEDKKVMGLKPYQPLPLDLSKDQINILKKFGEKPTEKLPQLKNSELTPELKSVLGLKPEEKLPLNLNADQLKILGLPLKQDLKELTPEQIRKLNLPPKTELAVKLTSNQKEKLIPFILHHVKQSEGSVQVMKVPGRLTPEQKATLGLKEDEKLPLLLTPDERKILGFKKGEKVTDLNALQLNKIKKISTAQLEIKLTPQQRKILGLKPDEKLPPIAVKMYSSGKLNELPRLVEVKLSAQKKEPKIVQLPGRLSPSQKIDIGIKLEDNVPLKLTPKEREVLKLDDKPLFELTQEQLIKINKTSNLELPLNLNPDQKDKLGLKPNEDLPTRPFKKIEKDLKQLTEYLPLEGVLPVDGNVPKELQELRKLCNHPHDTLLFTEDKECREPLKSKKCLKDGKTIQFRTVKFQLRSLFRDGIEYQKCMPQVIKTNIPVEKTKDCTVIKHKHKSGCINGKECEYLVTSKVKDCKCHKKTKKLGCRGCNCEDKSSRDVQCIVAEKKTTVKLFKSAPGSCSLTKSEMVEKISCETPQKTNGICEIKESNAILRVVTVPEVFVIDCKCVIKAKEIKEFCSCKEPTYLFKCDKKSKNRFHITVEFVQNGKKCEPKVTKTVSNPECPTKRFVEQGKCDRETCLQTVMLKERTFKDCKCDFFETKKQVPCCCKKNSVAVAGIKLPFRPRQFCDKESLVTISEAVTLKHRDFKVFPTAVDSPKLAFCSLETISSSKKVTCKQPEVTYSCNKRLNRWTYTKITYYVQDCKCKANTKVEHREGCADPPKPGLKCPPSKSTMTECKNGIAFRIQTINVLLKGKCETITKKFKLKCSCSKPIITQTCKKGKNVQLVIKENLNDDFKCQKIIEKKVSDMGCTKAEDKTFKMLSKSQCKKDGKIITTLGKSFWDPKKCTCVQITKQQTQNCRCKPCEPVSRKCVKDYLEKVTYKCEKLVKDKCVTYNKEIDEPIVCKNVGPETIASVCNENTGKQTLKVTEVKVVNCKCVPKTEQRQVFCNCHKNPKYKPKKSFKCQGNDILEVTHTQFAPNKEKSLVCEPKEYSKSTRISCIDTPRTEVTECRNCKQDVIIYNQQPSNCKCKKNIIEKKSVICCCPAKTQVLAEECKENTIYSVILTKRLRAGKCEDFKSIQKREIECEERAILQRKCSQDTGCKGKELLIIHQPKNCKCVPEIVRETPIECCCAKKFDIKRFCDRKSGIKITEIQEMQLIKDKCQMVTKRLEEKPKICSEERNCILEISPKCRKGFKMVFEKCVTLNKEKCACDTSFKKIADIPCNCIPIETIVKSECVGNYRNMTITTKKMVGKKCKDVILKTLEVPCKCEDTISEKCVGDKHLEKIYTYSSFNPKETKCITQQKVIRTPVPECNPHPKDLESKELPCEGDEQIIIDKVLNAKDCQCRIDEVPRTIPCKCKKELKTEVKCVNNKEKIAITKKNEIEKGKCVQKQTQHSIKLDGCVAKREVYGPCNPDGDNSGSSSREVFLEEFFYDNCVCKSKKKSMRFEKCSCKHKEETETCKNKVKYLTSTEEKLINGKCVKITTSKKEDMGKKCGKINKKEVGKPSAEDGSYKVTKTTGTTTSTCDCVKETISQPCDAKCESKPIKTECTGEFLLKTTKITASKDGCRCKIEKVETSDKPKCMDIKDRVTVSPCTPSGRNGDQNSYQEHVFAKHVKDPKNCLCKIEYDRKKILCSVPPMEKKSLTCKNDVTRVKSVEKNIVNPKLEEKQRITSIFEEKTINCEKPKYVNKCEKSNGQGVLETIYFEPKGCKCEQKNRKQIIDCACNPIKKLIGYGECDKLTCTKKVRYMSKSISVDGECLEFPIMENEKCCCPKSKKEVKCDAEQGIRIIIDTTYKLRNGDCVANVKQTREPVKCEPKVEEKTKCSKRTGVATQTTFMNKHRGCSCQMTPIEVKVGNCECKPPKTTTQCDKKRGRKIIKTLEEKLIDMNCVKTETVKYEPVKCDYKVTKIPQKCDKEQGIKKTIITTQELDDDCECKIFTKTIDSLCDCGKPKSPREKCDPKTGIILSTSYDIIKNNNQCKSVQKDEYKATVCLPLVWTPVPSDTCEHRTLEKGYRDGCSCKVHVKKEPCECECPNKSPTYKCAPNGNFMIKRTYEVHKHQCRCVYTHFEIPVPVYCPVKSESYSKCNTETCLQYKNTDYYEVQNCRCIKKTKSEPKACCCRASNIKVTCQKNFGIKEVTQNTPQLMNGKCFAHNRKAQTQISCDKLNAKLGGCVATGVCDTKTGTQAHTCLEYVRVGCECKPKETKVQKLCICKPTKRVEEPCNPSTCKKEVTIYSYFDSAGKCVEDVNKKSYSCCCKEMGSQVDTCEANRLISKAIYYTFDKKKGLCISHETKKDVSPYCKAAYTKKGKCENCKQAVYKIVQESVNCRCKERTFVIGYQKCCCNDNLELKEKCLDTKSLVITKRELLKGGQCHRIKTSTTSRILCPAEKVYSSSCDRSTCQQVVKVVTYQLKNCLCKMTIRLHHSRCCSNLDNYAYKICDHKTGRIVEKSVQYQLDPKSGVINEAKEKDLTHIQCSNVIKKKEGKCEIKDENNPELRFKLVKEIKTQRIACKCVETVKHKKILCGCGKPKEKKICSKDGDEEIVQTTPTVIIVQGNKICKDLVKVMSKKQTKCDATKPFVEEEECDSLSGKKKVTITEMVRSGCKCEPREKEEFVTCSCPKPEETENCKGNYKETTKIDHVLKCEDEKDKKNCKCVAERKIVQEKVDCPEFQQHTTPCLKDGNKEIHVTKYEINDCKCVATELPVKKIPCDKCIDAVEGSYCSKMKKEGRCNEMKIAKTCQSSCGFCLKENCRKIPKAQLKMDRIPHARLGADELKDGQSNLIQEMRYTSIEDCVKKCEASNTCLSIDVLKKSKSCKLFNVNKETLEKLPDFPGTKFIQSGLHITFKCVKKCPEGKVKKVGKCICENGLTGKECKVEITEVENLPTEGTSGKCETKTVKKYGLCGCVNLKPINQCKKFEAEGRCKDKDVLANCAKTCDPKCKDCTGTTTLQDCRKNKKGVVTLHEIKKVKKSNVNVCTVVDEVKDLKKNCVKGQCPTNDIVISNCIQGVRTTTVTTFTSDAKNGCSAKHTTSTQPCEECCPSVDFKVMNCVKGVRLVAMTYWESKNKCCVKATKMTKYECNPKCPTDEDVKSTCVNNKRLRHKSFYVGKLCTKKTVTNLEDCTE